MKNIAKALILFAILTGCDKYESENIPPKAQTKAPRMGDFDWSKEYRMQVLDEHVVRFASTIDTVYISLENATVLANQNYIAFIKK